MPSRAVSSALTLLDHDPKGVALFPVRPASAAVGGLLPDQKKPAPVGAGFPLVGDPGRSARLATQEGRDLQLVVLALAPAAAPCGPCVSSWCCTGAWRGGIRRGGTLGVVGVRRARRGRALAAAPAGPGSRAAASAAARGARAQLVAAHAEGGEPLQQGAALDVGLVARGEYCWRICSCTGRGRSSICGMRCGRSTGPSGAGGM